jgi:hypothetical protein
MPFNNQIKNMVFSPERMLNRAESQAQQYGQQALGYQQPYYQTGTQNMQTLSQMVNQGQFQPQGYGDQPAGYQDQGFQFQEDPGYQYRLQQGMTGIGANAAAGGLQLSGATQKALMKYGQNLASEEYQNAYNRYNTNRNFGMQNTLAQQGQYNINRNYAAGQQENRYNQFAGLAGMGQQAGTTMSGLASQTGQQMVDISGQRANLAIAREAAAQQKKQQSNSLWGSLLGGSVLWPVGAAVGGAVGGKLTNALGLGGK